MLSCAAACHVSCARVFFTDDEAATLYKLLLAVVGDNAIAPQHKYEFLRCEFLPRYKELLTILLPLYTAQSPQPDHYSWPESPLPR